MVQISSSVIFGGLMIAAAISGMMAWSRGRYAPRLFLLAAVVSLLASAIGLANSWPALLANLPTIAPLQLQLLGVLAVAAVGLTLLAGMIGLALGAYPAKLADLGRLPSSEALQLGVA